MHGGVRGSSGLVGGQEEGGLTGAHCGASRELFISDLWTVAFHISDRPRSPITAVIASTPEITVSRKAIG